MKIFLSHTSSDKNVVEPIAIALGKVFGRENIFYDSWSIQPGDGIIDKMNSGLEECDFFFLFISKKSVSSSEMVKMEWQNALMAHAKKGMKFIPVLLENCDVPAILMQTKYINAYLGGLDVTIRQMIDVVRGDNTFRESDNKFHNLKAYINTSERSGELDIEIRAEAFMEPIARFAVILNSRDAKVLYQGNGIVYHGTGDAIKNERGEDCFPFFVGIDRAVTPGFPFRVRVANDAPIGVEGVFHAVGEDRFERVPIVVVVPSKMFGTKRDLEIPLDDVIGAGVSQMDQAKMMGSIISDAMK